MKYKFVTKCTLITLFIVAQNSYSQDSYILNYEDVDIRKSNSRYCTIFKKNYYSGSTSQRKGNNLLKC